LDGAWKYGNCGRFFATGFFREGEMGFELSEAARREIDAAVSRYPHPHAAILPVLHVIQREHGHIPEGAKAWAAARLEMPPVKVEEVLSFYTLLHTAPVGGRHLQVCRSLPCWLRGEAEVTAAIAEEIGIRPGERTADGRFSLVEVECLGSCGTAPVVQVNDDYHEDLTPRRMRELIREWSR
jgi:NADH-quinone oxidoreductase E subunit